ncbi:MAG: LacI family DNA-binding transcriptional regulator [Pseudomonadota bacterium]
MTTRTGKTTSLDIAHLAGLSQSTVSRALNNSPLVNKETRDRVHEIARQLNYKPDRNAANLRTRKSRTLALLLFEEETADDSHINPFFLLMIGQITRAAANAGYDLLVSFQRLDEDWHTEYELSSRADGMILLGYGDYLDYRPKLEQLADSEAHFMIWGPMVEDTLGHSLGCDNALGGWLATRHLLAIGKQRIAFLGEASHHCPEFELRHRGFVRALAEAGLEPDPALASEALDQATGFTGATRLLENGAPFDAIFAASDMIALGAIRALRQRGLDVPGDVAVVGFDDIPTASVVYPSLTTVQQDTNLAGKLLVRNLIKLIEGESVESGLLAPRLVVRESCGGADG